MKNYKKFQQNIWNLNDLFFIPPSIDLIFTNEPNLIAIRGKHPSLHENCQHQITFARARLRVEYPLIYKSNVWNYAKAYVNGMNEIISQFNWQGSFTNLPINEQVNLFNSTLKNIFSNFILNNAATFKDQDPSWFGEKIKAKTELQNRVSKKCIKNGHQNIFIIYFKLWQVKFLTKMQKLLPYKSWKKAWWYL